MLTWGPFMWSAIHLNIPSKKRATWQWAEKCLWLFWGMFFPDVIAYQALEQRMVAQNLSRAMGTSLSSHPESALSLRTRWYMRMKRLWKNWFRCRKSRSVDVEMNESRALPPTKEEFTQTHGFYALMGGFALETNLCEDQFLPRAVTRVALTAEGLQFLATYAPEMLPDLPTLSEIRDKSKANNTTKIFACIQVLWFSLQCLERSTYGLLIALLEMTTICQCMYVLIIHFLWWGKPFSVEEPTTRVISGEKMGAILAYIWMSSAISCPFDSLLNSPEFDSMRFCPNMVEEGALPYAVSLCSHSHNHTNSQDLVQDGSIGPLDNLSSTSIVSIGNDFPTHPSMSRPSSNRLMDANLHHQSTSTASEVSSSTSNILQESSSNSFWSCKCCGVSCPTMPAKRRLSKIHRSQSSIKVHLLPGQFLASTGFCLRPDSGRFLYFNPNDINERYLTQEIYLESCDTQRWYLASLAITKYGLPAPPLVPTDYVELQNSVFPKTRPWQMFFKSSRPIIWKPALISGLQSLSYIWVWNYSFSEDNNAKNK
ncbi:uncharacterized protein PAC_06098 [Phialocephala subalpina]|uniref:Transcription factor domain-containing protein n=1 Tax=Phialocephala subalpina TaxID=576137 RepID=A0A1L7WTZ6_9HELO|nr:uncharacterized protein PAC_06098 [Phialocephala subalpina]